MISGYGQHVSYHRVGEQIQTPVAYFTTLRGPIQLILHISTYVVFYNKNRVVGLQQPMKDNYENKPLTVTRISLPFLVRRLQNSIAVSGRNKYKE